MYDPIGRARKGRDKPPMRTRPARRHRSLRLGTAAAVLLAAAALLPAAAPADAGTLTSAQYTGSGGSLHYELFLPSSAASQAPTALVVALHGCTQTGDSFRRLTHWDTLAEAKGFAVVFPDQDPAANQLRCWNFFQPASMHRGGGEPALLAGLAQAVAATHRIDPHHIYVAGLSAGGAMASVMGATYPDVFAAIGIGSGCEYAATAACAGYKSADPVQAGRAAYEEMGASARPMPFIAFEGDADTTVPPANADQLVQQWLVTDDLADDGAMNGSVPAAAHGQSEGRSAGGQSYTVRTYVDAAGAPLGEFFTVHGMGHAWSGGAAEEPYSDPSGPDETAAMYAFFVSHPGP